MALVEPFLVTILIPTRRRPGLLINTLQSILGQSRLDLVREIVISENSSDLESENVSERFSRELPIRFIRQPTELSADEHFVSLSKYAQSGYVALIGDDDMWSRYHLEEAERAFKNHPCIVAFFGQAVIVANETCYPIRSIGSSLVQVPSTEDRSLQDFYIWDKRQTAMQCMSHTPVNIWGLVADSKVLQSSIQSAFGESQFKKTSSCDKYFIWELAKHGKIAVGRHISLFYRRHIEAEMERLFANSASQVEETDFDLTMEIARQALSFGIDAPQDWRDTYERAVREYDLSSLIQPWNSRLSHYLLTKREENSQQDAETKKDRMQSFFYLITPPLIPWTREKLKDISHRLLKKS